MFQLIVKPGAGEMAQEAYDWYDEQQQGLGELFLLEFEKGLDKLELWPEAYSKIKKDTDTSFCTSFHTL